MKRAGVVLAAFAILAAGVASSPVLMNSHKPDTSCEAFASISIVVTGPGTCWGRAHANCTVLDESRTVKDDVFREWFTTGICDEAARLKAANDLADSVGTVWVTALATVTCTSPHFGCGWAMADPTPWGASFAEMLVESADRVLKTGEFPALENFCPADLLECEVKLGTDANKAMLSTCRKAGATSTSFHSEYAKVTKHDIAAVLEFAASGVCGERSKSSACNPATAGAKREIPICSASAQRRCCNSRAIHHRLCFCSRCHNPMRLTEWRPDYIWTDSTAKDCKCPPKASLLVES